MAGAATIAELLLARATDDRPGLLAHITSALSDEKTNIRSLEARNEFDATSDGALSWALVAGPPSPP